MGERYPSAEWRRDGLWKPSMKLKTAILASLCERKRFRSSDGWSTSIGEMHAEEVAFARKATCLAA
jgi:hypothetical protein